MPDYWPGEIKTLTFTFYIMMPVVTVLSNSEMKSNPILHSEDEKLAALHELGIPDTPASEEYNDIVALAAQICDTSIAAIAFAEDGHWIVKASVNLQLPKFHFHPALGTPDADCVIVNNAYNDQRFIGNPLLYNTPSVRFYAAMPIITSSNVVVGYLCVMDSQAHSLTTKQITGLRRLSRQATNVFNLTSQLAGFKVRESECNASADEKNTIFYNAPDAVIVINSHGTIVQWNPKAETIFGWSKEEITGNAFYDTIIPATYSQLYRNMLQRYEATGEEGLLKNATELSALRKDGSLIDVALSISPTTIKGQHFFICFVSDITDRKIITSRLDKQKEFYENILNSIPTDIAVFGPDHKYLFVNPGAISNEELRKYIIGKDDFEYARYRNRDIKVAEKRRENFLQVKKTKEEIRWEDTIRDPVGRPITHLRRLFPVLDDKGDVMMVIGFGIDITERKVMEEKQTVLVNQLSAQNKQLIDFCNIVSHNLRAPLVNMSMLVKFIEDSHDETEQKTMIAMLNPVIENLHMTFNELVESIQIKQDVEVESEKIRLDDCLERTMQGLDLDIKKLQAEVEMDFDEAPIVYYPSKYIHSIMHNLLSNALKYHSPDCKPIIKLKSQRNDNSIVLSVSDNGLGIDLRKHKDAVFKIGKVFHRHPDAKGFGLFMTKTHVEAMGGRIWVESEPGKGAAFFIELINQTL